MIELDPVDRITAGAVGESGERVFYLQGRQSERLVTLQVEKQQVELLAASLVEILARTGLETGEGPSEEDMGLEEPVIPEWRAGRLSLGFDEERDMVVLEAEEFVPEEEGAEQVAIGEPSRTRFWTTREQALALARHAAAVAAAGRPRCELCGNPIDPEGHLCPALNGHRDSGSV
ncbi:MAG: DUF3090 family protein [Actinomycetota bacterium]